MKIIAQNLIKIYGDRTVVNDISFEVNKGEVVGLLGPNGAGKTTTFYMVVGLVKSNGGKVYLYAARRRMEQGFLLFGQAFGVHIRRAYGGHTDADGDLRAHFQIIYLNGVSLHEIRKTASRAFHV